jgi:hypothetical protein
MSKEEVTKIAQTEVQNYLQATLNKQVTDMIDRDLHNLERKMENNIDNLRSELKEKFDYTSHKIEDLNRDIEPMLKNI